MRWRVELLDVPSRLHWRARRTLSVVYDAPLIFHFILEIGLVLTLSVSIPNQDHAVTYMRGHTQTTTIRPVNATFGVIRDSHMGGCGRITQSHSGYALFIKRQTALQNSSALPGKLGVHRRVRVIDLIGYEDASGYALQDQEATHPEEFLEANDGSKIGP